MFTQITVQHVSFAPQGKTLLSDISAVFKKNQLTTLVGPNGGGKSTLLKLISGIEKPTHGRILIRKNTRIGYMPQKISFDPNMPMTVERFLKNTDCLEKVGAMSLAKLNMATLSGGEMQRILLAYALQNKPDLLLLDEPTQGLDTAGEEQMYRLIFDYQKQSGCCVIMASHDLNFVLARSNQVLCLNGHLCCQGKPDKVKNYSLF
ncbi:MAG: metal ABC transporter ATP-binding protein, partial [Alphaproteobacteria bacterium]|nr:metal ABC transporter ATP-binding protein [Alphaproteobacteria bacterium]